MKQTGVSRSCCTISAIEIGSIGQNTCITLGYADLASSVETLSIMNFCSYTSPDLFSQLRSSQVDAVWEDIPINNPAFCPTETFTDTLTLDVV